MVFRHVGIRKCVDSTCRPIELALTVQTSEILPRKTDGLDITGPNDPVFADVLHNLLKGIAAAIPICYYLIISNDVLAHSIISAPTQVAGRKTKNIKVMSCHTSCHIFVKNLPSR